MSGGNILAMPYYPKISIVTPSYNQAEFIEETILSVLEQHYPNLEYIIIDGGSDDRSADIIKKYDKFISYWVSEKDQGQTDALIKGFNLATGVILAWLNSDDVYLPSTLHEVGEIFANSRDGNLHVIYGNALFIDRSGRPFRYQREIHFNKFLWLYGYNYIPQSSTFWTREIYDGVGGLDRRFDLAMDADLWIRFSEKTQIRHFNKYWSKMRFYPEQKNSKFRAGSDTEFSEIRKRTIGRDIGPLEFRIKRMAAKSARGFLRLPTHVRNKLLKPPAMKI